MTWISEADIEKMIDAAYVAMGNAYAPYSKFRVGACVMAADGTLYTGCNIENASYGATICAERTAMYSAIAAGEHKFMALAVISDSKNVTMPCGICRQVISEFAEPDMPIICCNENKTYDVITFEEILPRSFKAVDLEV